MNANIAALVNTKDPHQIYSDFIELSVETFEILDKETDLSPRNEKVNSCLSDFVEAVLDVSLDPSSLSTLSHPTIQRIRPALLEKLSQAEYEMERYFGEMFASRDHVTPEDLNDFWYRDCYQNLVAQEIDTLRQVGIDANSDTQICFVGSGPLPMTAIDMHLQTGARIICVDNDDDAIDLSRKMIANMGLSDQIEVHHADGNSFDYTGNNVVFVASLVGDKNSVIAKIRTDAPEAQVAVRSVEGLKAMLYEPVATDEFSANGYSFLEKSTDGPGTINTTLFFTPDTTSTPNPTKPSLAELVI